MEVTCRMDSDPPVTAAVHSHQSGKPSNNLQITFKPHLDSKFDYLVAGLTFGDGHVWHQVPVVSVPQGRRPPAHNHLARPEAGQDRPGGDHRAEHAPVLLQRVQPRGERVPGVLSLPDGQHVVPLLVPGVVASPVGLYQPLGLHIGDALLQLELNKREDLK